MTSEVSKFSGYLLALANGKVMCIHKLVGVGGGRYDEMEKETK